MGCFQGDCVVGACSDECHPGEVGCALYDVTKDAYVSLDKDRTHDRARLFEKWIQHDTDSLFHDQIVSVKYTTAALTTVSSVYIGDSALHTGIYLAAEAHRLMATGAPDARENVKRMVKLFDVLFHVSGDPGMLATSVFPAGDQKLRDWTSWDCAAFDRHCNVAWNGKNYDYVGDPSRDMYMGPLLGLVAAYDALGAHDEDLRELIRQSLVPLATELIRKRNLQVSLVINGFALPPETKEARFFIPETTDLVNGVVQITVDLNDIGGAAVHGGQDFMPNPSLLFRQFGAFSAVPDIPRVGSALMVGGIIRAAMHVSEGVTSYDAARAELNDFLLNNADQWGNAATWINVASTLTPHQQDCNASYFGAHINFIGAYTWGLLETDPQIKQALFGSAIGKMWADVGGHKNSFFNFGYGRMTGSLDATATSDATRQVEHFPAPPRIRVKRSGGCSATPTNIEDRPVYYLTWHANPWSLDDSGNTKQTYPGHDYLVAYWMGRSGGLLQDDTKSQCMRKP
jgi:hypothetical protein